MDTFINRLKKHYSWLVSLSLHLLVFVVAVIVTRESIHYASSSAGGGGSYLSVDEIPGAQGIKNEVKPEEKGEVSPPPAEASGNTEGGQGNSAGNLFGAADTGGLAGRYAEPSLGVRIRYPSVWSFIDQNKKKKLDGVTFIGPATQNGEIPYVHLKVLDKYLFNPSRYKSSVDGKNYKAYYNEPEELEGQYSQEMYIRTETDEDYSIKLIVNTEQAFKEFQPVFIAMVKTFEFGK